MMKSMILIWLLYVTLVLSQDQRCGPSLLTGSSGWFSSPLYPLNRPYKSRCDWEIQVQEGNSVLIQFVDLREGGAPDSVSAGSSYVRVFDANDESTSRYFSGLNMMREGGPNPTFLSKSNVVIVEFVSDGQTNPIGFNATYISVNANDFCGKDQLSRDGSINVEETRCQSEGMTQQFHSCQVTCSQHYVTKSDGKVICKNRIFMPEKPCAPIDWEVKLCLFTDMEYCVYTPEEVHNYLASTEDGNVFKTGVSQAAYEDGSDSGIVPASKNIAPATATPSQEQGIDMERRAGNVASRIQGRCVDRLRYHRSFCARSKNGNYAFSCNYYLRIKSLSSANAMLLRDICFSCRDLGCTSIYYI